MHIQLIRESFHVATAVLWLSVTAMAVAGPQEGLDVRDLKGIYTGQSEERPPELEQAIKALKNTVKTLYEIDLTTVTNRVATEPLIVVGRDAALESGLITDTEIRSHSPAGFVVNCTAGGIAIAGADQWSTIYGIYAFLEKIGVRFYLPNGHDPSLPTDPRPEIAPFSIREVPSFSYRTGRTLPWKQTTFERADCRHGLNPELFVTKKTGSDLWIDHTAGYLVPKLLYYDKHPEYYSMLKDGKRIAKDRFSDHRTPLCLSNPDVTTIATERALGWVAKNREKRYFPITYGDTSLWCQCPDCLKLDPPQGGYASRLLHWVNPVADAIAGIYPDKTVFTFSYGGSDIPPPGLHVAPNVQIIGSTGLGGIPFWDHAERNGDNAMRSGTDKIDQWLRVAPDRYLVCEYLDGLYRPALVDTMQSRLRTYRKKGIRGIFSTYGVPANFRPLWRYLFARVMWNVDAPAHAIADEFIDAYYAPANGQVKEIFATYHRQYQKTLKQRDDLVDLYPPLYYDETFVTKVLGLFEQARVALQDNLRLHREVMHEEALFIDDLLMHLSDYVYTPANTRKIERYLSHRRDLAAQMEAMPEFLRWARRFVLFLEKKDPRYHDWINGWLGNQSDLQPLKTNNGIRLLPESFLDVDYGPDTATEKWFHSEFAAPRKFCVGIYTLLTNHPRVTTRAHAYTRFDIAGFAPDELTVLELEGQDAVNRQAHHEAMLKKMADDMQIVINGHEIYRGPCGFVRGNWSRRRFVIPRGTLKEKSNKLEVYNRTRNSWPFVTAIILISDAQLLAEPAAGSEEALRLQAVAD